MPALRPGPLLRAANTSRVALSQSAATQSSIQSRTVQRGGYGVRALSTSQSMKAEHAHEDDYENRLKAFLASPSMKALKAEFADEEQYENAARAIISRQSLEAGHAHEHAHEDHYDPPSGWLWGVKPGEKPEKEGWENIFFYGFFGSLIFGAVGYAFKPDTSIQTWALEEARRRLEVEGILKEPEDKS